jgi:hypothetical protein
METRTIPLSQAPAQANDRIKRSTESVFLYLGIATSLLLGISSILMNINIVVLLVYETGNIKGNDLTTPIVISMLAILSQEILHNA